MAKQTKPEWVAADGTKWLSEEEAERHDRLIEASRQYEHARKEYERRLWETQRTADGQLFELSGWHRYWVIRSSWDLPDVFPVSLYAHDCHLDEKDVLSLTEYKNEHGQLHVTTYRINEIYADERRAKEALLIAQKSRLAEYAEQVKKLEESLRTTND